MTDLESRIREHRIWADLRNLGPQLDGLLQSKDLPTDAFAYLERLKAVLAYSGKRLAAADPLLTTMQTLDQIAAQWNGISSGLSQYSIIKNSAYLANASSSADNVLVAVSQLPATPAAPDLEALAAVASEYRSFVATALSEAEKKQGDLTAQIRNAENNLQGFAANFEAERQRLLANAAEQQGQFSASQEARSREFAESLRSLTDNLTKLSTDHQSQFSAAQEARNNENASSEKSRQSKFSKALENNSRQFEEQRAEFSNSQRELLSKSNQDISDTVSLYTEALRTALDDVKEKQLHVEKLVGVIGNLGVTSGYLRSANRARYSMWGWQAATLVSLITLTFLAYRTLGVLDDHTGHFNWGGFAGRALLLVSLGVIAAYCGSQADKSFLDERRSRKLALELEAIGPYLAPLPAEEQNKFRLEIGKLSFGREEQASESAHSPASILHLLKSKESKELLSLIVEAASKIKDQKG